MEKPKRLSELRRIQKQALAQAKEGPHYTVWRNLGDYEEDLPTFKGKLFSQYILEDIEAGRETSVLDVGCGQGIALTELMCLSSLINTAGISGYDYRDLIQREGLRKQAEGIDYRIDNMQRVSNVFQDRKFDYIITDTALEYSYDPLHIIKQCYRLLSVGGIAFFDRTGIYLHSSEKNQLLQFWHQLGIDAELPRANSSQAGDYEFAALSIRKSEEIHNLPLPFNYGKNDYNGRIWYKFNPPSTVERKKIA